MHSAGRSALYLLICSLLASACHWGDRSDKAARKVFDSYHEAVRQTVADPVRSSALQALGADLQPRLRTEVQLLEAMHHRLAEPNANYDTPRGELEAYLAAMQQRRRAIRAMLLSARTEAIRLTTPQEWDQLYRRADSFIDWFGGEPEQY